MRQRIFDVSLRQELQCIYADQVIAKGCRSDGKTLTGSQNNFYYWNL